MAKTAHKSPEPYEDTPPLPQGQRVLAKHRTIGKVLGAARRLFLAEAYEQVTIRGIARAAGMSTGAIFANFKDKEDVWRHAMGTEPPVDSRLTRAAGLLADFAASFDVYLVEGEDEWIYLKVPGADPARLIRTSPPGQMLLQIEARQRAVLAALRGEPEALFPDLYAAKEAA